ncbi:hypothetical protein DT075_09305 [Bacillus licheniformis]|nr:hypothetical protein DT075_09305 [Bacillus licheniformis]
MECSSKENISQEMIGRKTRKIRLGLFAYKRSLSTANFIFVPRKTIREPSSSKEQVENVSGG